MKLKQFRGFKSIFIFFCLLLAHLTIFSVVARGQDKETDTFEIRDSSQIISVNTYEINSFSGRFSENSGTNPFVVFALAEQKDPLLLAPKEEQVYNIIADFLNELEAGKKTLFPCLKILAERKNLAKMNSGLEKEYRESIKNLGRTVSSVWEVTGASKNLCSTEKLPKTGEFDFSYDSKVVSVLLGSPKSPKISKIASRIYFGQHSEYRLFLFKVEGISKVFAIRDNRFKTAQEIEFFYEYLSLRINKSIDSEVCFQISAKSVPLKIKYTFRVFEGSGMDDFGDEYDWPVAKNDFPELSPEKEILDIDSVLQVSCN